MKIVTLKITGGRGDKIAQFYDCGKLGDIRYEKAQNLLDGGGETADVKEFIDEHFEAPNVETFRGTSLECGQTFKSCRI